MAEKGGTVTGDIPKWKLALAVAAPVAVGLAGVWWYRRRRGRRTSKEPQPGPSDPACSVSVQGLGAEEAGLTPLERAQAAKNKGNKYFKGGKYDQAIACYGEAIKVCPEEHSSEISTFYQNRAAAYEQLKNYSQVVSDCTDALRYNMRYTKALYRRARAAENMGDLMQCLEDVTAVCILESFENQQSLLMADRVLKELGRTKAKANYKTRGPVEPSKQFIRTYFSTFYNDPILRERDQKLQKPEEKDPNIDIEYEEDEDEEKGRDETPEKEKIDMENAEIQKTGPYHEALQQFAAGQCENIVSLCSEEIGNAESCCLTQALLLRATFYHLRGEGNKAIDDLDRLLNMDGVDKRFTSNALIKRGSLRMQSGEQIPALDDFATAVRTDPENSDIYHHRGQLNLLIDRVDDAVNDFEQCVSLSPEFAVAHVQKCYTEYRQAFTKRSPLMLQNSIRGFEKALERFPDCAEGYALFGQALCDQQMFDKADENYTSALRVEPDNGNVYVHRGLLHLQWKQDVEKASQLISTAIEVDDKCEFGYETLGTIEVQRGNLDHAIELFNKSINLARTEIEMAHLYSLLDAAIAQSRVAKTFGIPVPLGGAS